MALSRDAILDASDVVTETVHVPEWGGDVIVRGLSGSELDSYQNSNRRFDKGEVIPMLDDARAKLVVRCLVDDEGNRLFKNTDAAALGKKSGRVIDRIYDVAMRLSGLTEDEQEAMGKDSEATGSDSSGTSSPETSTTAE